MRISIGLQESLGVGFRFYQKERERERERERESENKNKIFLIIRLLFLIKGMVVYIITKLPINESSHASVLIRQQ